MQLTPEESEQLLLKLDHAGFTTREMSVLTGIPLRQIHDIVNGTSPRQEDVENLIQRYEREVN